MISKLFKVTIVFVLLVLISSCQVIQYHSLKLTKNFGRTKIKTIRLRKEISDTLIRYNTANAILIFSMTNSKQLLEKELNKKYQFEVRDKEGTQTLFDYFSTIDSTLILNAPFYGKVINEKQMILGRVYYNWLARDLLLDKNAIVIQKENNQKIRKIDLEIYYDRLGNYRETFRLPNDSILIEGEIWYGE